MIDVFQFYKKQALFSKDSYSEDARKSLKHWDNEISSRNGFVSNRVLHLPVEEQSNIKLKTASGVILQDIIGYSTVNNKRSIRDSKLPEWYKNSRMARLKERNQELGIFNKNSSEWSFELFGIRKGNDDFVLDFKYSANDLYIGEPTRQDHQLASLKLDHPIQFRVNGKVDFSMTGRRQRNYNEYDYIIEYLGSIDSIIYLSPNEIERVKKTPEIFKTIDERKILY